MGGLINIYAGMTRKVYTLAYGRSEANLIIIGQYVRLFTISRLTSRDVIHFIYKIFCLTRNCLLLQYKNTFESNTSTIKSTNEAKFRKTYTLQ